jgi:hypothetical protein
VIKWIVAALWGGYTASNVLKWYWWRFNGYGYFWGMVTGIAASMVLPFAVPDLSALNSFPLILAISMVGCVAGTLLTKPDDEEVLKSFYRKVRPWGFWGPILRKVRQEDPGLQPNRDFPRDMLNVALGICWQTSLVVFPVCLVIRKARGRHRAVVGALTRALLHAEALQLHGHEGRERDRVEIRRGGTDHDDGTGRGVDGGQEAVPGTRGSVVQDREQQAGGGVDVHGAEPAVVHASPGDRKFHQEGRRPRRLVQAVELGIGARRGLGLEQRSPEAEGHAVPAGRAQGLLAS